MTRATTTHGPSDDSSDAPASTRDDTALDTTPATESSTLDHRVDESLTFPILSEIDASDRLFDAVRAAVKRRKGIVVICPQGGGKTIGLNEALSRHAFLQRAKRERNPHYTPIDVCVVRTMREKTDVEVLAAIYKAAFTLDLSMTQRGVRRSPSDLMKEVVGAFLQAQIGALVIDEAETLTEAALSVLRDIMSVSESMSKERFLTDGNGKRRYKAAGVGVVVIGTPELAVTIRQNREARRRWVRIDTIEVAPVEALPTLYSQMYPLCAARERDIGTDAWTRFINFTVGKSGLAVPIHAIENHLTDFHDRLVNEQPDATFIRELQFDQQLFLYSLNVTRLSETPELFDAVPEYRASA